MITVLLRSIILVVLLALVSMFELPLYVDAVAAIILVPASFLLPRADLLISGTALILAMVTSGAFLIFMFPADARYYREHEKYITGEGNYTPLVTDTINSPHGDLAAVDPTVMTKVGEPRVINFHTDSLGYRNDHDYDHEWLVLNGDSFVVGNGLSQELTLSAVLRRKYHLSTYSIAFPSDPIDYESRAAKFLEQFPDDNISFVHFFYEGNDFEVVDHGSGNISLSQPILDPRISHILSAYQVAKAQVWGEFSILRELGRIGTSIFSRVERSMFLRQITEVDLIPVGDTTLAFHRPQGVVATARRLKVKGEGFSHPEVWNHTSCLFIIPTKDRVYRNYLSKYRSFDTATSPTTTAVQEWLDTLPITSRPAIFDITPVFEKKAAELSAQKQFLYWKDDTHLNAYGAELLADSVVNLCNPVMSRTRVPAPHVGGGFQG